MYRRRFIPDEIVDISSDKLIKIKPNYIITEWVPINPRDDFKSGYSYTFLNYGFKISKFFDASRKNQILVLRYYRLY